MYRPNRVFENGGVPYRNDRFYCMNGEWFFAVRRGPDKGPYASREEARVALKMYIEEQLALEMSF